MGSSIPPSGDDPAPDVLAAFEKQLGLRLEKGKMQIDVVTILIISTGSPARINSPCAVLVAFEVQQNRLGQPVDPSLNSTR